MNQLKVSIGVFAVLVICNSVYTDQMRQMQIKEMNKPAPEPVQICRAEYKLTLMWDGTKEEVPEFICD